MKKKKRHLQGQIYIYYLLAHALFQQQECIRDCRILVDMYNKAKLAQHARSPAVVQCVMASSSGHGRRERRTRRRRGCGSWRTGWARTAARGTLSACTRRPPARGTTAAVVRRHAAPVSAWTARATVASARLRPPRCCPTTPAPEPLPRRTQPRPPAVAETRSWRRGWTCWLCGDELVRVRVDAAAYVRLCSLL